MKIWIDAQIATWIKDQFIVDAIAVRDVGLRDSSDEEIFEAARKDSVIILRIVTSYGF